MKRGISNQRFGKTTLELISLDCKEKGFNAF